MSKIYTKTGDKGKTGLIGGIRKSKCDVRIEAYGTVDEFNSQLGLLASFLPSGKDKDEIIHIQSILFDLGSRLACDKKLSAQINLPSLNPEETLQVEKNIDEILSILPPIKGFILPSGTQAASIAHVCRTICRRAERRIVALMESGSEVDEQDLKYINRLSDYLFVLARKLNFDEGVEDIIWKKYGI